MKHFGPAMRVPGAWREGGWYLQATDSKDANQSRLLSFSELQTPDHGHGKDDDCEICDNVYPSIGKPHGKLVDAACRLLGPERSYRNAGEDAAEDGPDGVANDDGEETPACDPELLGREHSVVLKKNGALRHSK